MTEPWNDIMGHWDLQKALKERCAAAVAELEAQPSRTAAETVVLCIGKAWLEGLL